MSDNINQFSTSTFKEFVLPLAAIFLVSILSSLIIIPNAKKILEFRSQIVQQEVDISQLTGKVNDLKTLSEPELQDSAVLMMEALPAEKDFYKMLVMTRQLLGKNNISMESFIFNPGQIEGSTASAKTAPSSDRLTMTVNFLATVEDFKTLLGEVDKMLPLVKLDELRFGSLAATESASLFGFYGKMSLTSYYYSLPKSLGDPKTPLPKLTAKDNQLLEELKGYYRYQAEVPLEEELPSVGRDNPFSI